MGKSRGSSSRVGLETQTKASAEAVKAAAGARRGAAAPPGRRQPPPPAQAPPVSDCALRWSVLSCFPLPARRPRAQAHPPPVSNLYESMLMGLPGCLSSPWPSQPTL